VGQVRFIRTTTSGVPKGAVAAAPSPAASAVARGEADARPTAHPMLAHDDPQLHGDGPPPRVTIGLPVYNGARYLRNAIESLLSQSFTDFELILCDNASTDQTQSICTAFAARDPRVRYHRNERNIGAAGNFNLAFKLARGRYFKWAAHDDLHAPDYLQRCVELLDNNPRAVVAHTGVVVLDSDGHAVPLLDDDVLVDDEAAAAMLTPGVGDAPQYLRQHLYDPDRETNADDPAVRLHELLTRTKWCFEIFGLMRVEALRRTPLHLTFYGSDKVLLAAMALQGKFLHVPEAKFFRRHHVGQSSSKSSHEQALWMTTSGHPQYVPPQMRCLQWYVRLIARSGLPLRERLRCLRATGQWVVWLLRLIFEQRNERGFLHRLVMQLGGRDRLPMR
jgi:hypothetical protein